MQAHRKHTAFTNLAHHIDLDLLKEAHRLTRKNGAVGVDGRTAMEYGNALERNLRTLLARVKSGRYKAPAVRRVYIPKGTKGDRRPIGIPTFEDKILQRAVAMILGAIYDEDFMDCSYGFRPKRGAHQLLDVLWKDLMGMKGGWLIELDISKFFDKVDHGHLRAILGQRVRDKTIMRLVGKWLNAGVLEERNLHYPREGTPQGGVISPLLSNVYLHEVLDKWFYHAVCPRMVGEVALYRFADDATILFAREEDAHRVMAVLAKRFARYGLTLHPVKTKLVDFRVPSRTGENVAAFDLLGFTHFWAKSRKGNWIVKRKTANDRFQRAVREVTLWCKRNRHKPAAEQQQALVRKLRGHCAYYGITGNSKALQRYRFAMVRIWRKWLGRRSRERTMGKQQYRQIMERYPIPGTKSCPLRPAHVANVYPEEPDAGIPHVRICGSPGSATAQGHLASPGR